MAAPIDPKTPQQADATRPPESGEPAPHPRYDEEIKGDSFEVLRHYQKITLPPDARQKLLSAQLPAAAVEQLFQDTVPPNGGVTASGAAPSSTPSASTVAPVVDKSRSQATLLTPRVRQKRRLRVIVAAALGAAILLLVVGVIVMRSDKNDSKAAAGQDRPPAKPADSPSSPSLVAAPPGLEPARHPSPTVAPKTSKPTADLAKPPKKRASEPAPVEMQSRKPTPPATPAPKPAAGLLGTELARPPAD